MPSKYICFAPTKDITSFAIRCVGLGQLICGNLQNRINYQSILNKSISCTIYSRGYVPLSLAMAHMCVIPNNRQFPARGRLFGATLMRVPTRLAESMGAPSTKDAVCQIPTNGQPGLVRILIQVRVNKAARIYPPTRLLDMVAQKLGMVIDFHPLFPLSDLPGGMTAWLITNMWLCFKSIKSCRFRIVVSQILGNLDGSFGSLMKHRYQLKELAYCFSTPNRVILLGTNGKRATVQKKV